MKKPYFGGNCISQTSSPRPRSLWSPMSRPAFVTKPRPFQTLLPRHNPRARWRRSRRRPSGRRARSCGPTSSLRAFRALAPSRPLSPTRAAPRVVLVIIFRRVVPVARPDPRPAPSRGRSLVVSASLITPADTTQIWTALLASASFGYYANRTQVGGALSGPVCAMLAGALLANVGVLPPPARTSPPSRPR